MEEKRIRGIEVEWMRRSEGKRADQARFAPLFEVILYDSKFDLRLFIRLLIVFFRNDWKYDSKRL